MPNRSRHKPKQDASRSAADRESREIALAIVHRAPRHMLEQFIIQHVQPSLVREHLGSSIDELGAIDVLRGKKEAPVLETKLRMGGATGGFGHEHFTDELLLHIMQFLPCNDRCRNLFAVCRSWYGIVSSDARVFMELSIGSNKAQVGDKGPQVPPGGGKGGRDGQSGFFDASTQALFKLAQKKPPINLSSLQHLRLRGGQADPKALLHFLMSLQAPPIHLTLQRLSKKGVPLLGRTLHAFSRKKSAFLASLHGLSLVDCMDENPSNLQRLLVRLPNLLELHLCPDNPWCVNYNHYIRTACQSLKRARSYADPLLTHLTMHSKFLVTGGVLPEFFFSEIPSSFPSLQCVSLDLNCTGNLVGSVLQTMLAAQVVSAGRQDGSSGGSAAAARAAAPRGIVEIICERGVQQGGVFAPRTTAAAIDATRGTASAFHLPSAKFYYVTALSLQLQGLCKEMGTLRMSTETGVRGMIIQSAEQQAEQERTTNDKVQVLFRLIAFYFPNLQSLSVTVRASSGRHSKKNRADRLDLPVGSPAPLPLLAASIQGLQGLTSVSLHGFTFPPAADMQLLLGGGDSSSSASGPMWIKSLRHASFSGPGAQVFAARVRALAPQAHVQAHQSAAAPPSPPSSSSSSSSPVGGVNEEKKGAAEATAHTVPMDTRLGLGSATHAVPMDTR